MKKEKIQTISEPAVINIHTLNDMLSSDKLEPSLRAELNTFFLTRELPITPLPMSPPETLNNQSIPEDLESKDEVINETNDLDVLMETDNEEEPQIKISGPAKSLALEEGHIQEILSKTNKWSNPVTRKELEEAPNFTRLIRKFIDYEEIDIAAAIQKKNDINNLLNAEENLNKFRAQFASETVQAEIFRRFDLHLELKVGLLPIISKLNQAAAGSFVEAAEQSYHDRGTLIDKRARYIKKQLDGSIDVECPLSTDQRKTFSRFKLANMLQSLFGEILWFDRRFVSALEDLPGGQAKISRLAKILNILGIEEKWAQANQQLQDSTQLTCIDIALNQLKSQITTIFYVSEQEQADRANESISDRTRKKALKKLEIVRPLTPPSDP